jgi:hypothetical protein
MSQKVVVNNSATKIIFDLIKSNVNKKLIIAIPSNICPKLACALGKRNKLISLPINKNHFINQNYLKKIIKIKKIGAVLLVYPYGHYTKKKYYKLIKELNNKNILVLEDFCLCNPIKILKNINKLINNSCKIFSTGYTKFVDLNKGGFGIFNNEKYSYILKNNKKFTINFKKKYQINPKLLSFETFKKSIYFKLITKIAEKRQDHSRKINKIYNKLLNNKKIQKIKGGWRFCFKVVSNKNFLKVKKLKFNKSIFFGYNYNDILNDKKAKKYFLKGKKAKKNNLINLFNDFRYNKTMAKTTALEIRKCLK